VNYFLKEEKQFVDASNESHDVVFIDRGIPDILAYMHYIGDSYPASLTSFAENMCTARFSFFPWEEIYVSDEARYEN
jgi:predicted ATPase